jgi:hypothetical protein
MFDELQEVNELVIINKEIKPFGNLICISAQEGTIHSNHISLFNNNFFYSLKIYKESISSNLYLEMDSLGNVIRVLKETEGTLPELFIAPNNQVWSINTCLDDSKDMEIALPIANRNDLKKAYKHRSFVGEWLGNIENTVIFFNDDLYGKKPDQICKLEFMKKDIVKRKIVKIPLPKLNKICIDQHGCLQMIAWHEGNLLHRNINLNGDVLEERIIDAGDLQDVVPIRLSFNNDTELLGFNNNFLYVITIKPTGEIIQNKLIELDAENTFYNIWTPQLIESHQFIIRFNGEKFNGWAVIKMNRVVECFINYEDSSYYTDIISNMVIELPKSNKNNFVISGLSVNNKNTYQVAIYNAELDNDQKQIYIISRQV